MIREKQLQVIWDNLEKEKESRKKEAQKLWDIANEAERRSKKISTTIIAVYFVIAFILSMIWFGYYFKDENQSILYLTASVAILVLFGMVYSIKEDNQKIKRMVEDLRL